MAHPHCQVFQRVAGVIGDVAIAVEHGEAPAAAIQIALVGGDKLGFGNPGHAIRLPFHIGERLSQFDQIGPFIGGVYLAQIDAARAEVPGDCAGFQIHQRNMIIFLKGDYDHVVFVDIYVFRFWISRIQGGDAGQIHSAGFPAAGTAYGINNHQTSARQLRRRAVAKFFIALVFNRNGDIVAVLAGRD